MSNPLSKFEDLIEDVIGALSMHASAQSEYAKSNLEIMHTLGESIVRHPSYRKGAHGQGELLETIAGEVKRRTQFTPSPRYLANCIEIYAVQPKFAELCKRLEAEGRNVNAHSAMLLLHGDKEEPKEQKCKHCPIHCK